MVDIRSQKNSPIRPNKPGREDLAVKAAQSAGLNLSSQHIKQMQVIDRQQKQRAALAAEEQRRNQEAERRKQEEEKAKREYEARLRIQQEEEREFNNYVGFRSISGYEDGVYTIKLSDGSEKKMSSDELQKKLVADRNFYMKYSSDPVSVRDDFNGILADVRQNDAKNDAINNRVRYGGVSDFANGRFTVQLSDGTTQEMRQQELNEFLDDEAAFFEGLPGNDKTEVKTQYEKIKNDTQIYKAWAKREEARKNLSSVLDDEFDNAIRQTHMQNMATLVENTYAEQGDTVGGALSDEEVEQFITDRIKESADLFENKYNQQVESPIGGAVTQEEFERNAGNLLNELPEKYSAGNNGTTIGFKTQEEFDQYVRDQTKVYADQLSNAQDASIFDRPEKDLGDKEQITRIPEPVRDSGMPKTGDDADELYQQIIDSGKISGVIDELGEEEAPAKTYENYSYSGFRMDPVTGDLIVSFRDYTNPITSEDDESTTYDEVEIRFNSGKDVGQYNEFAARFEQFAKMDESYAAAQSMYGNMPTESETDSTPNSWKSDISSMNSIFNISEKYGKNAAAAESARIAMTGDENLYLNGYTVDTTTGDLVVNLTDKTKAIYGTDAEGNESIIGYETTKTEKYSPTNEAKFESFIDNVFRYNVAQNALNKMIYNLDGVIDDEEDKQLKNANKDRMDLYSGLDSYYYYGQALYNRNEALKNVTGNVDYSFGDISVDSKTGQTVVSFVDTTKPIYATDENNEFILDENNNKIITGYEKAGPSLSFDYNTDEGQAQFREFINKVEVFGKADSWLLTARKNTESDEKDYTSPAISNTISDYISSLTEAFDTGADYQNLQTARAEVTGDAGLYLNGFTVDTDTGNLIIGLTDKSAENTIYGDDGKISGYKNTGTKTFTQDQAAEFGLFSESVGRLNEAEQAYDKALYVLDGNLSSDESEALGSINSYYTDTLSGMQSYFGIGTNATSVASARKAVTGSENLYLNGYTVDSMGNLIVGITDRSAENTIYADDGKTITGYKNTETKTYSPTAESEFGAFLDNVLKLNLAEYRFDKSIYNADGKITDAENTQMEADRKSRDQLYTGLGLFFDYGISIADQRAALQKATGNADYYFGGISVDPTSGEVVVGFVDTTKPIYATDENNEFLLDENNNKIITGYEKADAEKRFDIGKEGGIAEFQTFIKDIEDFGLADSRMAIAKNKAEGNTDESKPVVGDSLSGYITDLTNAFQTGSGYYALQSAREAVTGDAGLYLNGYTVDTETGDLIVGITDRSAENTIYGDDGEISGYKNTGTKTFSQSDAEKFKKFGESVVTLSEKQYAYDESLYKLDGSLSSDEEAELNKINSYYTDTLSGMKNYYNIGTNLSSLVSDINTARADVTGSTDLYLTGGYSADTKTGKLLVGVTDKSEGTEIFLKNEAGEDILDESGNKIISGYSATSYIEVSDENELKNLMNKIGFYGEKQAAYEKALYSLDGKYTQDEENAVGETVSWYSGLNTGLNNYYDVSKAGADLIAAQTAVTGNADYYIGDYTIDQKTGDLVVGLVDSTKPIYGIDTDGNKIVTGYESVEGGILKFNKSDSENTFGTFLENLNKWSKAQSAYDTAKTRAEGGIVGSSETSDLNIDDMSSKMFEYYETGNAYAAYNSALDTLGGQIYSYGFDDNSNLVVTLVDTRQKVKTEDSDEETYITTTRTFTAKDKDALTTFLGQAAALTAAENAYSYALDMIDDKEDNAADRTKNTNATTEMTDTIGRYFQVTQAFANLNKNPEYISGYGQYGLSIYNTETGRTTTSGVGKSNWYGYEGKIRTQGKYDVDYLKALANLDNVITAEEQQEITDRQNWYNQLLESAIYPVKDTGRYTVTESGAVVRYTPPKAETQEVGLSGLIVPTAPGMDLQAETNVSFGITTTTPDIDISGQTSQTTPDIDISGQTSQTTTEKRDSPASSSRAFLEQKALQNDNKIDADEAALIDKTVTDYTNWIDRSITYAKLDIDKGVVDVKYGSGISTTLTPETYTQTLRDNEAERIRLEGIFGTSLGDSNAAEIAKSDYYDDLIDYSNDRIIAGTLNLNTGKVDVTYGSGATASLTTDAYTQALRNQEATRTTLSTYFGDTVGESLESDISRSERYDDIYNLGQKEIVNAVTNTRTGLIEVTTRSGETKYFTEKGLRNYISGLTAEHAAVWAGTDAATEDPYGSLLSELSPLIKQSNEIGTDWTAVPKEERSKLYDVKLTDDRIIFSSDVTGETWWTKRTATTGARGDVYYYLEGHFGEDLPEGVVLTDKKGNPYSGTGQAYVKLSDGKLREYTKYSYGDFDLRNLGFDESPWRKDGFVQQNTNRAAIVDTNTGESWSNRGGHTSVGMKSDQVLYFQSTGDKTMENFWSSIQLTPEQASDISAGVTAGLAAGMSKQEVLANRDLQVSTNIAGNFTNAVNNLPPIEVQDTRVEDLAIHDVMSGIDFTQMELTPTQQKAVEQTISSMKLDGATSQEVIQTRDSMVTDFKIQNYTQELVKATQEANAKTDPTNLPLRETGTFALSDLHNDANFNASDFAYVQIVPETEIQIEQPMTSQYQQNVNYYTGELHDLVTGITTKAGDVIDAVNEAITPAIGVGIGAGAATAVGTVANMLVPGLGAKIAPTIANATTGYVTPKLEELNDAAAEKRGEVVAGSFLDPKYQTGIPSVSGSAGGDSSIDSGSVLKIQVPNNVYDAVATGGLSTSDVINFAVGENKADLTLEIPEPKIENETPTYEPKTNGAVFYQGSYSLRDKFDTVSDLISENVISKIPEVVDSANDFLDESFAKYGSPGAAQLKGDIIDNLKEGTLPIRTAITEFGNAINNNPTPIEPNLHGTTGMAFTYDENGKLNFNPKAVIPDALAVVDALTLAANETVYPIYHNVAGEGVAQDIVRGVVVDNIMGIPQLASYGLKGVVTTFDAGITTLGQNLGSPDAVTKATTAMNTQAGLVSGQLVGTMGSGFIDDPIASVAGLISLSSLTRGGKATINYGGNWARVGKVAAENVVYTKGLLPDHMFTDLPAKLADDGVEWAVTVRKESGGTTIPTVDKLKTGSVVENWKNFGRELYTGTANLKDFSGYVPLKDETHANLIMRGDKITSGSYPVVYPVETASAGIPFQKGLTTMSDVMDSFRIRSDVPVITDKGTSFSGDKMNWELVRTGEDSVRLIGKIDNPADLTKLHNSMVIDLKSGKTDAGVPTLDGKITLRTNKPAEYKERVKVGGKKVTTTKEILAFNTSVMQMAHIEGAEPIKAALGNIDASMTKTFSEPSVSPIDPKIRLIGNPDSESITPFGKIAFDELYHPETSASLPVFKDVSVNKTIGAWGVHATGHIGGDTIVTKGTPYDAKTKKFGHQEPGFFLSSTGNLDPAASTKFLNIRPSKIGLSVGGIDLFDVYHATSDALSGISTSIRGGDTPVLDFVLAKDVQNLPDSILNLKSGKDMKQAAKGYFLGKGTYGYSAPDVINITYKENVNVALNKIFETEGVIVPGAILERKGRVGFTTIPNTVSVFGKKMTYDVPVMLDVYQTTGEFQKTIRPRSAGIITHPEKGIVLTQEETGLLNLPGGGIDSGEKPKAAFFREVFEETGLKESDMTGVKKVGVWEEPDELYRRSSSPFLNGMYKNFNNIFEATLKPDAVLKANDEVKGIFYWDPTTPIPENVSPGTRTMLEDWLLRRNKITPTEAASAVFAAMLEPSKATDVTDTITFIPADQIKIKKPGKKSGSDLDVDNRVKVESPVVRDVGDITKIGDLTRRENLPAINDQNVPALVDDKTGKRPRHHHERGPKFHSTRPNEINISPIKIDTGTFRMYSGRSTFEPDEGNSGKERLPGEPQKYPYIGTSYVTIPGSNYGRQTPKYESGGTGKYAPVSGNAEKIVVPGTDEYVSIPSGEEKIVIPGSESYVPIPSGGGERIFVPGSESYAPIPSGGGKTRPVPVPSSGMSKPVTDSGRYTPTPGYGGRTPKPNYGRYTPTPGYGGRTQKPKTNYTIPGSDGTKPVPPSGNKPIPDRPWTITPDFEYSDSSKYRPIPSDDDLSGIFDSGYGYNKIPNPGNYLPIPPDSSKWKPVPSSGGGITVPSSGGRIPTPSADYPIPSYADIITVPDSGDWKPIPPSGGRIPGPNSGGRIPSPNSGGRIPSPNSGRWTPSPNSGGRIPSPNSGGWIPSPNSGNIRIPPPPSGGKPIPPPPSGGNPIPIPPWTVSPDPIETSSINFRPYPYDPPESNYPIPPDPEGYIIPPPPTPEETIPVPPPEKRGPIPDDPPKRHKDKKKEKKDDDEEKKKKRRRKAKVKKERDNKARNPVEDIFDWPKYDFRW